MGGRKDKTTQTGILKRSTERLTQGRRDPLMGDQDITQIGLQHHSALPLPSGKHKQMSSQQEFPNNMQTVQELSCDKKLLGKPVTDGNYL